MILYASMKQRNQWNWQQSDWPKFQYNCEKNASKEDRFRHETGILLGSFKHIDPTEQDIITIELMMDEAVKTSEIEGENLDRVSLQSSIRRQFGLASNIKSVKPVESGIAEMMVDLYKSYLEPLSNRKLFEWHAMIMNGRRDLDQIGQYRRHEDPMQIVSGRVDKPIVHFEAPPSSQVYNEMTEFIDWFNRTAPGKKEALPALTRASIAHLYFESIHPFEDGNGRIGRAISEKIMAQSIEKPIIIALSHHLFLNRKKYYERLEKSNKSNQLDDWIDYFSDEILSAININIQVVEFYIKKSKFYDQYVQKLNSRQSKVIEKLFRTGINGFEGGLSAEKYLSITKTSRATATRDLQDLVKIQALKKTGIGKGTRYYLNLE